MEKSTIVNVASSANDAVLTPASESGIRALFEGLVAVNETLVFSAPAQAGIAITPSIFGLLHQYCGDDPRFALTMANVFPMEWQTMKENSIVDSRETRAASKRTWLQKIFG